MIQFLLFVPVQQVVKELLHVDVRDVVVLTELGAEVGLATGWRTSDEDLHRSKVPRLLELLLHRLDVGSKTIFTVPLEADNVIAVSLLEDFAWCDSEIE